MNRFRSKILLSLVLPVILVGCSKTTQPAKEAKTVQTKEKSAEKSKGGEGKVFQLTSSAFGNGQSIPVKYANKGVSGGENISIPLSWENAPEGTKSFAIAMVDRHPIADNWVHWLVINIPASATSLAEGASGSNKMPASAEELNNTFGYVGYGGPQPPPGSGDHDYETTIYALNVEKLSLNANTTLDQFLSAIEGQTLGTAKLTGKFLR